MTRRYRMITQRYEMMTSPYEVLLYDLPAYKPENSIIQNISRSMSMPGISLGREADGWKDRRTDGRTRRKGATRTEGSFSRFLVFSFSNFTRADRGGRWAGHGS